MDGKLSSASRRIPQTSLLNALATPSQSARWQRSISPVTTTSLAIRNASTTSPAPQPVSSATASPALPVSEPSSFPNLDTITLDNVDLSTTADITSIPEKIGYLHEIGLNYGWGPTSILEFVIEHIHIYAGVPWWASIAATACLYRLALSPLYLKSSDIGARSAALAPVTKPITDRMTAAKKANDTPGVMLAWQQLREVRGRAGITFSAQFAPIILQGIFAFCGYRLIRRMADLPVPAFRTDGFLWLQDLTLSDPYLLLPIIMGTSIHALVRMGGETGAAAQSQMGPGLQKFMLWGMPGITILFTGWLPGAVCVWFAASGAWGILQARALQNSALRRYFKMAPLYRPKKGEADKGPLAAVLGDRFGDLYGSGPNGPVVDVVSGKNAAFTNPKYQSPNLRHSSSSRPQSQGGEVIDVKPANRMDASGSSSTTDPDMVQPIQQKSPGVFEKTSKAYTGFKNRVRKESVQTPEQMEERRRKAFKRRAEEYEARARGRKGSGR